jgi:hypothetical protein
VQNQTKLPAWQWYLKERRLATANNFKNSPFVFPTLSCIGQGFNNVKICIIPEFPFPMFAPLKPEVSC